MSQHPKADHVVMDARTQEFVCRHCGVRFKPSMPMPISEFVKKSKAFTELHEDCEPPAAGGEP